MTLLETSSTTENGDTSIPRDSIRLEPGGDREWLVVPEEFGMRSGEGALALIRQEAQGYACYPNTFGYGRLGPYRTLDEAFDAAVTHMTGGGTD